MESWPIWSSGGQLCQQLVAVARCDERGELGVDDDAQPVEHLYSYGLYSCGLYSYGMYSYGLIQLWPM